MTSAVFQGTNRADQADVGASPCSFVVPFLPFEIEPYRPGNPRCYECECSDGERSCVTRNGADPHPLRTSQ